MDRVEVIWTDCASDDSWVHLEDNFNTLGITSVGFLVKDVDNQIWLTQSLSEHSTIAGRLAIPKPCVISIKKLRYE